MRVLFVFFVSCTMAAQQRPDWQIHLDWSIRDQGHVDCGEQILPISHLRGLRARLERPSRLSCARRSRLHDELRDPRCTRWALRSGARGVAGYSMSQWLGSECHRSRRFEQCLPVLAAQGSVALLRAGPQGWRSHASFRCAREAARPAADLTLCGKPVFCSTF